MKNKGADQTVWMHRLRLCSLDATKSDFLMTRWERSGSVVECLARDQEAVGSSLTGVTARHIYPSLVLVQPRKTCPCLTERLLMGIKNQIKHTNKQTHDEAHMISSRYSDLMDSSCGQKGHILISWYHRKSFDLDLHCFNKRV